MARSSGVEGQSRRASSTQARASSRQPSSAAPSAPSSRASSRRCRMRTSKLFHSPVVVCDAIRAAEVQDQRRICGRVGDMTARSLLFSLIALAALAQTTASTPQPQPAFAEPAIAPDGSEIAFVSGGDIWTVPAAGGEARLLISYAVFYLKQQTP